MNWLSLALQLLSVRNSFIQSRDMLDGARAAADRAAEKAKRAAIFGGFCAVGAVFFTTGTILLVIELGLQADRGEFIRFSGLVGSSLAFYLLAAALVGLGALVTRESAPEPAPYIPPPPPSPEEELRRVGTAVLNRFLSRIREGSTPRR